MSRRRSAFLTVFLLISGGLLGAAIYSFKKEGHLGGSAQSFANMGWERFNQSPYSSDLRAKADNVLEAMKSFQIALFIDGANHSALSGMASAYDDLAGVCDSREKIVYLTLGLTFIEQALREAASLADRNHDLAMLAMIKKDLATAVESSK